MTSVNDYLKKLLYQYDCVVVPELGAFLTHYQSAAFTEANGVYLPPRKRVAFNEALRFDDGILLNYLMLHESIARDAAQRCISQFVSELHQEVDVTGRFELEGIGTFTKNEESRLQFSPSLRHNFFGEAFGLNPITAQTVDQKAITAPAIEAVPVTTALGPVLVEKEEVMLTPYRSPRPYWRVAAIALLISSLGAISYSSVMQPGEPLQSSLDPASLLRAPIALYEKLTEAKAKEAAKVVLTKKQPSATPSVQPVDVKPIETPALTVTSDKAPVLTAAVEKVEPTNTPKEVAVKTAVAPKVEAAPAEAVVKSAPAHTGSHFTVIAGVFLSKQNALRLRRQLKKAGYDDAFVIMPLPGQKEMYKVAAAGSSIRSEAVAKMAAIDSLAGTESWILKN